MIRGSALIGQSFTAAGYYGRPPPPPIRRYNSLASGGSTAASNPELDAQQARVAALRAVNPASSAVPVERETWRRQAGWIIPDTRRRGMANSPRGGGSPASR